jgi:acyl-CoA thioester hydrolase
VNDRHNQLKKLIRTIKIEVRWGDMDAMGHVNNTCYFRYLEIARIDWIGSIGAPTRAEGSGPILVAATCNFRIPIVYPETIEVRTYSHPPGRSSIPLFQEIWSATRPDLMYADGESTAVWVDYQKNKSAPMPDAVRALLTP